MKNEEIKKAELNDDELENVSGGGLEVGLPMGELIGAPMVSIKNQY